jgi:predicted ABC-type ATPase
MNYTIFAGVNGAGKSSLYSIYKSELDLGVRVNTDEIVGKNWKNPNLQIQAGRKAIELKNFCFENKISLNQETTLTGNSILKSIENAKRLGYNINLYYIKVDSEKIAISRVKDRVHKGGHGIPEDVIKKRFKESYANLFKILMYCDSYKIFDNTDYTSKIIEKIEDKVVFYDISKNWSKEIYKYVQKNFDITIEIEDYLINKIKEQRDNLENLITNFQEEGYSNDEINELLEISEVDYEIKQRKEYIR